MPAPTMTAIEENARHLARKRLMRDFAHTKAHATLLVRIAFRQWDKGWAPRTDEEAAYFHVVERAIFTVSF